jgi:hypothetical protein
VIAHTVWIHYGGARDIKTNYTAVGVNLSTQRNNGPLLLLLLRLLKAASRAPSILILVSSSANWFRAPPANADTILGDIKGPLRRWFMLWFCFDDVPTTWLIGFPVAARAPPQLYFLCRAAAQWRNNCITSDVSAARSLMRMVLRVYISSMNLSPPAAGVYMRECMCVRVYHSFSSFLHQFARISHTRVRVGAPI